MAAGADRVGIAWRPELAHGLYQHLDAIDVVEILADAWLADARLSIAPLQAWGRERPLHLHGTRLGLASAEPLDARLLERWAALVAAVRPAAWSEHLAITGAGARRLPHFLPPPRTAAGLAAVAANLRRATQVVGQAPLVENPAALMEPPGSTMDEATWLASVAAVGGSFLLDLHNLYATAHVYPGDPLRYARAVLGHLPLQQVRAVHVAGGRAWQGRWLDDHRHAVPQAVWWLLEDLAAYAPGPLEVIIEWDGDYPPLEHLLAEVAHARQCLAAGRQRAAAAPAGAPAGAPVTPEEDPQEAALQRLIVELVSDAALRARFRADPDAVGQCAGIAAAYRARWLTVDHDGIDLTARSLAAKGAKRG